MRALSRTRLSALALSWLRRGARTARGPGRVADDPHGAGLRVLSEQHRLVADSLPQLVWIERPETGETVYANRAFDAFFATRTGELMPTSMRVHPDDRARIGATREAAAEGRACEARLRRPDGSDHWHRLTFQPLRAAGTLVGWLGSALDIDEMVVSRKALEETGDLLRLAQEAAGAGLFDIRIAEREAVLSPGSARMHGLPSDRPAVLMLGDWLRRVHPHDRTKTLRAVRDAVAARRTFDIEFRVPLPDAGVRWIQAIGRPCNDGTGAAVRITGLHLDVSARKEVEFALVEAKRAAEQANAAKTEFLSAMSHEIRTPLNAVIGFAGLLAGSGRLDGELHRYAELVRASGANLLTVVNDILDFSSVEAGTVTLRPEPFALEPLVDGCLAIVGASASAKALDTVLLIDAELPRVLVGDEARLRQVLLNLLNNAVKFTQRGSITLSLRHEGRTPWGERIRVSVADTGIGIAAEKQPLLFERFYQVDASIRRDHGGTGLGLSISKRLVERMGGEIGVSSLEGHGSTFWFTLTLPRASAPPARVAVPAGGEARRQGRILLVEDIDINRELACVMLRAAGHEVDVAENGFAAVRAAEAGGYDLVLMDIQMPGMDGLMATRLIRCLPGPGARVPIVAMTANVLPDQVRAFREAGLDDHLGKPFTMAGLGAAIDRWLPGAVAEPEAEAIVPDMPALALDRERYEDSLGLLPSRSVARLLVHLGRLVGESFRGDCETPASRDRLRGEAHAVASASGIIGFTPLSTACAALQSFDEERVAAEGPAAFEVSLSRVRAIAAASHDETRRLIADMDAVAPATLARGRVVA